MVRAPDPYQTKTLTTWNPNGRSQGAGAPCRPHGRMRPTGPQRSAADGAGEPGPRSVTMRWWNGPRADVVVPGPGQMSGIEGKTGTPWMRTCRPRPIKISTYRKPGFRSGQTETCRPKTMLNRRSATFRTADSRNEANARRDARGADRAVAAGGGDLVPARRRHSPPTVPS